MQKIPKSEQVFNLEIPIDFTQFVFDENDCFGSVDINNKQCTAMCSSFESCVAWFEQRNVKPLEKAVTKDKQLLDTQYFDLEATTLREVMDVAATEGITLEGIKEIVRKKEHTIEDAELLDFIAGNIVESLKLKNKNGIYHTK